MSWITCQNGEVPLDAVVSGCEDKKRLQTFIARAKYSGGIHPCKKVSGRDHAHVSYGDKEYPIKNYEIYIGTGKWEKVKCSSKYATVPANAILAGNESDGKQLYIARGIIDGNVVVGKVGTHLLTGAHLPYFGKEVRVSEYEVLCK